MGLSTATASACYHPGTGVFMNRDPGTSNPAIESKLVPQNQYLDGMNFYQYSTSSPVVSVDPQGLVSEQPLVDASKMFLNRVLGVKMGPHFSGNHPTTAGAMPLVGGILWGLSRAYADSGSPLTPGLIAKRAAEFGTAPAITYSAMAYYFMTNSKTALAIAKAGGVLSRTSLYAAAFYTGFQIGDKLVMNPLRDLQNEAWFYKNKASQLEQMRSQGNLLAVDVLRGAPKVCCGSKVLQLGPTSPEPCANQMIQYFGLAAHSYGYFAWGDVLGDSYEDFKNKNGTPGKENPERFKHLLSTLEDAINKYVECVKNKCDGDLRPYPGE